MKVAVLSTISRKAGGLFYSVRWLSKGLSAEGCSIRLFSPADEFSKEDLPEWAPLPVELFPAWGPLKSSSGMRRALAAESPELIHLHGIWSDAQWIAAKVQRSQGCPVVVSPRGMLDPWAVGNAAWKKRLVEKLFARRALEQATCIHALCRSELESIRAYGLKNPVAVIPNGIELPEMGAAVPTSGKKKLLFLGRIHPKKGVEELIRAWSMGPREWELVIAGWDDGGHEADCRRLAGELGVEVTFAGAKYGAEKDALLRSVDAFILPSFSEGLPMSVLEAWAYRLPVVMTDFCNLPEGFEAGAAIRVEPSAASVFQGLEKLESLPEAERAELASRGRQLVEERFTWPHIARDMKKVYDWCVQGGDVPDCVVVD